MCHPFHFIIHFFPFLFRSFLLVLLYPLSSVTDAPSSVSFIPLDAANHRHLCCCTWLGCASLGHRVPLSLSKVVNLRLQRPLRFCFCRKTSLEVVRREVGFHISKLMGVHLTRNEYVEVKSGTLFFAKFISPGWMLTTNMALFFFPSKQKQAMKNLPCLSRKALMDMSSGVGPVIWGPICFT